MMADERNVPAVDAAEGVAEVAVEGAVGAEELDISEKLKNAAGNIRRAGAGARTRKSESEKSRKQSEAEAQARIDAAEKKLKEDEERARLVAEQKMAALEYAQNYRKKLQKDRQKAMSAAKAREKAEREAEEAAAREQRAKEIAELLEKERNEARERGEKASELLNRVTKCAVVDENGNLRMVDKIDLLKEKAEEEKEEAARLAEKAAAAEQAPSKAPEKAPEVKVGDYSYAPIPEDEKADETAPLSRKEAARIEVEEFLEGEMMRVEGDSYVLDIEDDAMTVSLTDKDDPAIIPEDMVGPTTTEEPKCCEDSDTKLARALAEHEAIMHAINENAKYARAEMTRILQEEQERFAKEAEALRAHRDELAKIQEERRAELLSEIAALAAAASACAAARNCATEAEKPEEPIEEIVEEAVEAVVEEPVECYAPVFNNDPTVLALRRRGNEVSGKCALKRYIKKSNKAIKKMEKSLASYDDARAISDESRSKVALCYAMNECGKILEIRCDNLSAAARIRHDKLVKKLRLALYSEIERYNRRAGNFEIETGADLTKVSAFLPDHLTNNTGKAIIPVLAYRDRYEQLKADDPELPRSYVVSFPSVAGLKAGESTEAVSSVYAMGGEKTVNPITTKTLVEPELLESDLLSFKADVVTKKSFKKLRKLAKKAYKAIDKKALKLAKADYKALDAQTKKELKAANKKVKKYGVIVKRESAVEDLLLAREKVLVGSRVLIDAVKLDNAKWIGRSRINLEELFGSYNKKADACERICNTPITKIHPLTTSKVAESMLVPDMPDMVHVNELFETVGDSTRIVGDPSGKKADDPDGSFTFLVGGSNLTDLAMAGFGSAKAESSPAAGNAGAIGGAGAAKVNVGQFYSVKGMPYPPMCQGAYIGGEAPLKSDAAESAEAGANSASEGATAQVAVVSGIDTPVISGPLSGKELAAFRKESEKKYKQAGLQFADISGARSAARGDERVELDVRALTVKKELIDSLADSVYVASVSSDKKLLKRSKKRLNAEIEAHNEIVDDLALISGVHLSRVPDTLYEDIISGNGYSRTPKIEYQVIEQPAVHYLSAGGEESGMSVVEVAGDNASAKAAALHGKELDAYKKSAEKNYSKMSAELNEVCRSMKKAGGNELLVLNVKALQAEKAMVEALREDARVATASGDKAYAKKTKKRLAAAAKEHNELVDGLSELGGVSLTKLSDTYASDVLSGKDGCAVTKIEYRKSDVQSVYPVAIADNGGKAKAGEVVEIGGALAVCGKEKMTKKMYFSYVRESEKEYKKSKKALSKMKSERKGAKGEGLVECEVSELSERKKNIDRLCENLAVAVNSGDKKLEKTAKSRLKDEIKAHNALVGQLEGDGGVKLSRVSETVIDDIIAGKGYRKTAKLEYAAAEPDTVHTVSLGGAAKADRSVSEKQAVAAVLAGTASAKVLNSYIKKHNKSYLGAKKSVEELEKAGKRASGAKLVETEVEQLAEQRLIIDDLCEGLAVAVNSGNSSYAKTTEKRLLAEIKKHNSMVERLNKDGGVSLAPVSASVADEIKAGRGYRKSPKIELRTSQGETVQQVALAGAAVATGLFADEISGADMTKSELRKYKAESNKSYKSSKKTISSIEKSKKNKDGNALVEAEVAEINAKREKIDRLCSDLAVASSAGDKKFAKVSAKKLTAEIKEHNKLVMAFNKKSETELSTIDADKAKAILDGKGYTKTPKLEYNVSGTANAYGIKQSEAEPSVRILNLTSGALTSPTLTKKELKKHKKSGEKSYSSLSAEADKLAKSRKGAVGGERVDLDIKELEVRKEIIDGLCDTAVIAQGSGNAKLLKTTKKRLNEEVKAHNALVDDLAAVGGLKLTKAPATLYNDVVSGQGYNRVPRINLEVAEYAPAQQVIYTEGALDNAKGGKKQGNAGRGVVAAEPEALSKKQIKRGLKANEKAKYSAAAQIDDLKTKNKAAVGVEKHKILVGLLNAQRSVVESEASTLALLRAEGASRSKISKQKKKLEGAASDYNKYVSEYQAYTGDTLTPADEKMAEKIVNGQPFDRIKVLEMTVAAKAYEYIYADYEEHDKKRNEGRGFAAAKSQAEAEKQNAISYELAVLGNAVKRQADKDNRTVAAAFMYAKGLIQCEDDCRNYSYGLKKSKDAKIGENIVSRCKRIDKLGKRAINAENEANKRYYEVVMTNSESVEPVGKKRRWKLIPFFKKKYKTGDITYLRDEIMHLLNERDRVNGQLISIYEGQVLDMGGKPLTLDIRRVKAEAAKKMYNSRQIKVMAKRVDRKIPDSYDRNVLYSYLNNQIEAESNIAVIDYRLKHAKDDLLTDYEIKQLKMDRKTLTEEKEEASLRFRRMYKRCRNAADASKAWMAGLGILILLVAAAAVGIAWFIGPDFLDNLKNWFGI